MPRAVDLPPELVSAVRARQLAEQEALEEKSERERQAAREKLEAEGSR